MLSGQQTLTKTDLKGTEHPMADAFGDYSNRSGENDDILGHHQISWVNGKDCVQQLSCGGYFEFFFKEKGKLAPITTLC